MLEYVIFLVEWVHFVLRHARDVQLGQHVDRVLYAKRRSPRTVAWVRRYIAMMGDHDHRQRHEETLIRAGY